jgi:hypothetical protein
MEKYEDDLAHLRKYNEDPLRDTKRMLYAELHDVSTLASGKEHSKTRAGLRISTILLEDFPESGGSDSF